jgi:hypothetical protein
MTRLTNAANAGSPDAMASYVLGVPGHLLGHASSSRERWSGEAAYPSASADSLVAAPSWP